MSQETKLFFQGKQATRECFFCYPPKEMILFETSNFRVLMDNYPVVLGHLMITTKAHYGAAGEVPPPYWQELFDLKEQIANLAIEMEGNAIYYEHGRAGACHVSSRMNPECEHFHLHCLPADICIHSQIEAEHSGIKIEQYEELFDLYYQFGSYFYFENNKGEKFFYPVEEDSAPAHHLRTLVCNELGSDHLSSWENFEDLEKHINSRKKIKEAWNRKVIV